MLRGWRNTYSLHWAHQDVAAGRLMGPVAVQSRCLSVPPFGGRHETGAGQALPTPHRTRCFHVLQRATVAYWKRPMTHKPSAAEGPCEPRTSMLPSSSKVVVWHSYLEMSSAVSNRAACC